MVASIVDTCSAVVSFLNNATQQAKFSQTFTAARVFSPAFDREGLSELSVAGFAAADTTAHLSRGGELHSLKVGICIRKPVNPDSTTDGDAMLQLCDEVKDVLKFESMNGAGYESIEIDPIFSIDYLEQRREFLAVVMVNYLKGR